MDANLWTFKELALVFENILVRIMGESSLAIQIINLVERDFKI